MKHSPWHILFYLFIFIFSQCVQNLSKIYMHKIIKICNLAWARYLCVWCKMKWRKWKQNQYYMQTVLNLTMFYSTYALWEFTLLHLNRWYHKMHKTVDLFCWVTAVIWGHKTGHMWSNEVHMTWVTWPGFDDS